MVTTVDSPFFKIGVSQEGTLHAATVYWGSGLCDAPLEAVDDRHSLTGAQISELTICQHCSAVISDVHA